MNRIKALRKSKNLSQAQLASLLFVNQTAVSQWERGATSPNKATLLALCDLFDVSIDYLLGRESQEPLTIHNRIKELRIQKNLDQKTLATFLNTTVESVIDLEIGYKMPTKGELSALCNLFDCSSDYLFGYISTPYPPAWPAIPILGSVAAGTPAEAVENIIGYEEISPTLAATGEFFALRVDGASMEPRMKKGDLVIVRKQEDVESGDIAVVLVNGDAATIKRIKKGPEGLMLIPSNPSFEPMFYTNEEIRTLPVTIIGKVVELHAKL